MQQRRSGRDERWPRTTAAPRPPAHRTPPTATPLSTRRRVLGEREPAVSADAAALAHENASLRRELQQAQAALATAREQLAATQRKLAAAVGDGGATA